MGDTPGDTIVSTGRARARTGAESRRRHAESFRVTSTQRAAPELRRFTALPDAGGGTRTPDTRIMIPLRFGSTAPFDGPEGHERGHMRVCRYGSWALSLRCGTDSQIGRATGAARGGHRRSERSRCRRHGGASPNDQWSVHRRRPRVTGLPQAVIAASGGPSRTALPHDSANHLTARQQAALDVIAAHHPRPITSTQLATELQLPPGTLNVTLRSLQRRHLIAALPATARRREGWTLWPWP
jgi:hypothetical protein